VSIPTSTDGREGGYQVAWGLVFVVVGVALLGERMGFLGTESSGRIWPLIVIAVALAKLAQPTTTAPRPHRSGAGLLFIGLWGLANEMHLGGLDYRTSWPILVIGAGVSIVWQAFRGGPPGERHGRCPGGDGRHAA
jgi:hypothetical protein